jgi:threonine dehydrogenase-like Zn-dependent dehydrogenase
MKALQFPGDKEVVIKDFADPKPALGEVLIRVKAAGICGSDLNYLYRTPKEEKDKYILGVWVSSTVIPGHEPCGIIEEVGEGVTHFKKGDRVIVYHISGCGICKFCREGQYIHCKEKKTYGFDFNGVFADLMVAKAQDCIILPAEIPFSVGSYCACGAGTAYKALKRLNVSGLDTVTVFGLGPVGLAAVLFAKKFGAKVIAIDPVEMRRNIALQVGADCVIDPINSDPVQEILTFTKGEGSSVGIECSSNPTARSQILDAAKLFGRVAYVGEGKDVHIDVSNQIIHKQLTLLGSWVYSISDLIELLDYVKNEQIDLSALITNEFSLDQAEEAMKLADSGNCGKVMFTWK